MCSRGAETYIFHAKEFIAAIIANWSGIHEHPLQRSRYGRIWVLLGGGSSAHGWTRSILGQWLSVRDSGTLFLSFMFKPR